mmetsp:Transcript_62253/g.147483  ORF Transcript_62253/g.147483 Transcript_62253/m.147483 type:complete len:92 (-) Transcript_62253:608-883(-)
MPKHGRAAAGWSQEDSSTRPRLALLVPDSHRFHPKDYILLAASGAMLRTIAGTAPLNHKGIENVNVSDIVSSHLDYERKIQELGDKLQFWF